MEDQLIKPDFLFEASWEVCNKVGGIHTVVSTKALSITNQLGDNYILIGPDVWRDDAGVNPEFIEDNTLYEHWRKTAYEEGMHVRMGKWNISGQPIAMLVDFSHFIHQKDAIFAKFWETYKLDSLSGQWDYIEPALFGYAVGRAIESFVSVNLVPKDKVVAQFHEWMTGIGILYIEENMPQIATVFTTHATVLGRCLAANNRPLYKNLRNYKPEDVSREFNIVSKQSLESLSASTADGFSTVSDITSVECTQFLGKNANLITPNGFEDSFVPEGKDFDQKRKKARNKLTKVAEALLGYKLSKETIFTAISGRYEFKNKGIDVFIESLGELNKSNTLNKDFLAFVLIPANHFGPRKDLLSKLQGDYVGNLDKSYITHYLHDEQYDPILNKINRQGLTNSKNQKVKVIFVPSYLNGDDGILNLPYYDVLIGLDLTVFPSYYEPWGYTPLESLAFSIPTITTSLTGFGLWVTNNIKKTKNGIKVIERTDENDKEVIHELAKAMAHFAGLYPKDMESARTEAYEISRIALWKNFVDYYFKLYSQALTITKGREHLFIGIEQTKQQVQLITRPPISKPQWNRLYIKTHLTEKLAKLDEISKNLWWSWNYEAKELFEQIDPHLWKETNYNPIALFETVDYERFKELEKDTAFLKKLGKVALDFEKYMSVKPSKDAPQIAYFSMEFGLQNSLKIYSGGLGILAGDYLKEASDCNVHMTAIGLLYKYGYFTQMLSISGDQQATYEAHVFNHLPLQQVMDDQGNWLTVTIVFPGRTLTAKVWKVNVGRIPLYLLDADIEENTPMDRFVTHHLYGGDLENRLKQEMLLGIGGVRTLEAIHIHPDIYHCNEGHAAFLNLERLRSLIRDHNLSFEVAKEVVSVSSLFTTHTPVPAGHDAFPEELLRVYMAHYPERLKIDWDELMNLGRYIPFEKSEKFSMSVLAAKLSKEMNGVSLLHGQVSQEMFAGLWPGYFPQENHISYVTNGVHYYTWTAKEWQNVYKKQFGEEFLKDQSNKMYWQKIHELPDEQVWETKQGLKVKLIDHIKHRLRANWINRHESPKYILDITDNLKTDALIIGFARRFATYKRAGLLFQDINELKRILSKEDKPVLFLFAGKAHPHDGGGQDLIRKIVQLSKSPEFIGKVLFLQNYDMALAEMLVAGVDVWLNTPTRPLEASGTSGEKAAMNGTMHFSVLDGWWVEGYQPNAGWCLPQERTYENQDFQNELDAETLYHILEHEIIKLYYTRNKNNIPTQWVQYIKNTISEVAPRFTMKRMLDDYFNKFYTGMFERSKIMLENDFSKAKDLALWKKMIAKHWDSVEAVSYSFPENMNEGLKMGRKYTAEIQLRLKNLLPDEVGVELVIVLNPGGPKVKLIQKQEYKFVSLNDGLALYRADFTPNKPGSYDFGIRMFPKNKNIPCRHDCSHVKWI